MPFTFIRKKKSSPVQPDVRLQQSRHVLATAQGDEVVLFDTQGERYYTLNEVGVRVWMMLGEPTTLEQIVASIHREYDVADRRVIADDVSLLLGDLQSAGLLAADPAAGRP